MTKTIILLKGNFKATEKNLVIFNNEYNLIISLDYESHKQLEDLKIYHLPFENYLDKNDFKMIDDATFKINTSWHKNKKIQDTLTFDEINFGWLLEQEFFLFLLATITTFTSLIKIRDKEKNLKKIIVSNVLLDMSKTIFSGYEINTLDNENQESQNFTFDIYPIKYNIGSFPLTIRIPRKYFFILQKIYDKSFIPLFQKLFSNPKKNISSVLLLDFNSSKEDEFLECLSKKNTNIFMLNRRRSAIWNLKSFSTVKNTNSIPITYEQFLNSQDKTKIEILINDMKIKLDSLLSDYALFSKIFSINGNSFWPHIQNYFKNFCLDRFSEAIYEMIGSRKLLSQINPSVILHYFGIALQEKIIIHEAKKQNISSTMIQHGAPFIFFPRPAKLNPFAASILPIYDEKMAVWGSVMKEYALDNGMNEDSIIVSGSTRHDSYFKANSHNDKGIILVALLPYYFKSSIDQSIDSFKKYEESLKIICNTLKKITDRKKIIKLHPTDMKFLSIPVELIIRNIDPSIQIVVDADLSKLIPSADIVITLGLTTFILDSNVFHKPTVTLLYDHEEFVSKLSHGYSELFKNHEAKKFELYIQNILVNEKLRNENIEKGSDFLYSYLSNHGNASEYLANKVFDELI
jgi:hypothetical protein